MPAFRWRLVSARRMATQLQPSSSLAARWWLVSPRWLAARRRLVSTRWLAAQLHPSPTLATRRLVSAQQLQYPSALAARRWLVSTWWLAARWRLVSTRWWLVPPRLQLRQLLQQQRGRQQPLPLPT